jgi:hypothetical protein
MTEPHYALTIAVITEGHVSTETWHITDELAAAIRAEFGEPVARQLVPIEMADEVIDDPRHVAL